jgi:PST family polysaccharide transporter
MEQKAKIFSTSITISLICSAIIAIVALFFKDELSELILKDTKYSSVFLILAFTVSLYALNGVLQQILNGQKEIKKYILINIISSIFSLFFTSFLIYHFHLIGAFYALVLNQSVIFFITLTFVAKSSWFKLKYFVLGLDKESLIKLSQFSLMAIVSAISVPASYIIVRDYIGSHIDWDSAGYFQGVKYISDVYLMVITTSLSVYYLPRLSEITDTKELKKEIIDGYKIILPIVIILALGVYIFRDLVIAIAFTDKFSAMEKLFKWQLIGDVIMISSWILAYLMLAKAMTKVFVITEVISSILFVVLSILFINNFGLVGVTYAFALNYLIYLFTMLFIFRKVFK